MTYIDPELLGDSLNRMVKLALDTGEAATVEEAHTLFAGYALHVGADAAASGTPAGQAALLTIVNAASRTFLGGVTVALEIDAPLAVPMAGYSTVAAAVEGLGGTLAPQPSAETPLILIGKGGAGTARSFAVRIVAGGWRGGCVPADDPLEVETAFTFAPAAVLAAAIAVTEGFLHVRRATPVAGRRRVGLSLWRPELDWLDPGAAGPPVDWWPSAIWMIGLGNLGQACLWTLGMLPYAEPANVQLTLQDFDRIAESNNSTSMLTGPAIQRQRKTRAMAAWAETRGFDTRVIERRFAADFRVGRDDPAVALCGVDNALARRALEDVGFARIIEAGLGGGPTDFLALRLHTFPSRSRTQDLWPLNAAQPSASLDRPAYQDLAAAGAETCGLTRLAGRTVGAPFVGTVAATLMIAELVRMVNGAHNHAVIDAHLKALDHRVVVPQDEAFAYNSGGTS